ncbi:MAG: hypothetical protein Q9217_005057 [Psora testacea]
MLIACLFRSFHKQDFTRTWLSIQLSSRALACQQPQRLPISVRTEPHRGVRTKAAVRLDDLFDGVDTPEKSLPELKDGPAYPTVVQQAHDNMRKYGNCVLLTRVGSFYELYLEQADKYGPLLNLKVAQKKTAVGPVSMAGFPFYQLDRFLKILVQDLNEYVAISEEFANTVSGTIKSGELKNDRRVTRTITPGTLIDEKFMDPYEHNFLLAIHLAHNGDAVEASVKGAAPVELQNAAIPPSLMAKMVGLSWLDLSTGDFFTQRTSLGALPSAAARIGAREIVVAEGMDESLRESLLIILEQQRHLLTYHKQHLKEDSIASWTSMLETEVPDSVQSSFTGEEVSAGSLLLSYVHERLQGSGIKLQPPVRRQDKETMSIDKNSMRALEVLSTSKEGLGGGKGSLLHTVRRTVTKSGTRLLRNWIASPSMSLKVINGRLDLVSHCLEDRSFRENVVALLKRSYDSQRLVQKFCMGRGDADDLVSLLKTVEATNGVSGLLQKMIPSSQTLHEERSVRAEVLLNLHDRLSLKGPNALADLIKASIDEDGLMESHRIESNNADIVTMAQEVLQNDGTVEDQAALSRVTKSNKKPNSSIEMDTDVHDPWILRKTASNVLQRLHEALDGLQQDKTFLTNRLREDLHAQSLTLRWTPGLGYICHVKGTRDVSASLKTSSATREVKTTKSTRSFHHTEWSSLGGRIDQAKMRIRAEEQRLLQELREQVVLNLVSLRRNATVMDELDIGCAFATLAEEQGFVRPILNNGLNHNVIGGRHPTVKLGLEEQGRAFVSNDCTIGEKERIWLITGPNMAGKSTFLRQNALISILAQVGSFVPAEYAEIGLVDQIYTRVGSADNLFRDQSTFMVEMMETAAILNQATPQSFVIMDEIGRGTTPEDGVAVGFACLHHLYHKNRCRTLFATHFHSLADMTKDFSHLGCYCTDVAEGLEGSFSFVHRLRPGVNRSSHALKVARLAGLPPAAIETARIVLKSLEIQRPMQPNEISPLRAALA